MTNLTRYRTTMQTQRDILYRLLTILDYGKAIPASTVSNSEFCIEGDALVDRLTAVMTEARNSLSKESDNA